MKKLTAIMCIVLMLVSLAGCSQQPSGQKTEEELREEIRAELEAEANRESQPEAEDEPDGQKPNEEEKEDEEPAQQETESNTPADGGRIEVAAFAGGKGFDLVVEKDKTKEVTRGVPVYYLSMKYTNGEKKLLVQSVDRGDDWSNSIAEIIGPTMSNDGKRVYYSTDNTFNRGSGYGANDYHTRVIDLNTFEDSYFGTGALVEILNSSHGPYADHVVVEMHSLDNAGNPTMVYQVVTPSREQVVMLEAKGDWLSLIEAELDKYRNTGQSEPSSSASDVELTITNLTPDDVDVSSLVETIHGYNVEYSRYYSVIAPYYPADGKYPFKSAIEFINPAYDNTDTVYYFAVMGTIHDVRLQSQADMNSDPKLYKVADTIEDAIVMVTTSFPTDFSFDKIHYRDFNGINYAVTFTNMTDEVKVHAIKLPY